MDDLIYGVIRGVDAPAARSSRTPSDVAGSAAAEPLPEDRRLLVFAVDTRTHSAPRLLLDLDELGRLDEADLPADAYVTPYVFALAGPAPLVTAAYARFMAHLRAEYARIADEGVSIDSIPEGAEARLVGLEAFTPERFTDLVLRDLLPEDSVARYIGVTAPLPDGWEAAGVYLSADWSDRDDVYALLQELLAAWLEVEAVPGRDRPWARRDTERVLNDPRYAFGLRLEPEADLRATTAAFTRGLAERPERWDLAQLEAEYRALFARLEASGRFHRGPDVAPVLPVADWLRLQHARIAEFRQRAAEP
jgi:hypothetical protein